MATLQRTLSDIRELQADELDIIGGAGGITYEQSQSPTTSGVWVSTPQGGYTLTVTDDMNQDVSVDWS